MLSKAIIFLVLNLFLLLGCREVEPEREIGLQYFPMPTSALWEYQVDIISYNAFTQSSDTLRFYMRLISEDTLFKEDAFTVIHLLRYDSLPGDAGFVRKGWYVWHRSDLMATVKDDHSRLVKLVFPVLFNKRWDQNTYQAPEKFVRYSSVNEAYRIPMARFDDCIVVTEKNDSNFFQVSQIFDVYANGVGLVRRHAVETEVQNDAKSGYTFNMTLIRFQP